MKITFGVIDLPYSHSDDLGKSKSGKSRVSTTGDVAEILEEKYGVMEYFWDRHQKEIVAALEDGIEGTLNNLLNGAPPNASAFIAGEAEIEELFQKFLDAKEMDYKVDGVPTGASLKGVSHRFKRKRGPVRPSFIDTGLYESSFVCKVVE